MDEKGINIIQKYLYKVLSEDEQISKSYLNLSTGEEFSNLIKYLNDEYGIKGIASFVLDKYNNTLQFLQNPSYERNQYQEFLIPDFSYTNIYIKKQQQTDTSKYITYETTLNYHKFLDVVFEGIRSKYNLQIETPEFLSILAEKGFPLYVNLPSDKILYYSIGWFFLFREVISTNEEVSVSWENQYFSRQIAYSQLNNLEEEDYTALPLIEQEFFASIEHNIIKNILWKIDEVIKKQTLPYSNKQELKKRIYEILVANFKNYQKSDEFIRELIKDQIEEFNLSFDNFNSILSEIDFDEYKKFSYLILDNFREFIKENNGNVFCSKSLYENLTSEDKLFKLEQYLQGEIDRLPKLKKYSIPIESLINFSNDLKSTQDKIIEWLQSSNRNFELADLKAEVLKKYKNNKKFYVLLSFIHFYLIVIEFSQNGTSTPKDILENLHNKTSFPVISYFFMNFFWKEEEFNHLILPIKKSFVKRFPLNTNSGVKSVYSSSFLIITYAKDLDESQLTKLISELSIVYEPFIDYNYFDTIFRNEQYALAQNKNSHELSKVLNLYPNLFLEEKTSSYKANNTTILTNSNDNFGIVIGGELLKELPQIIEDFVGINYSSDEIIEYKLEDLENKAKILALGKILKNVSFHEEDKFISVYNQLHNRVFEIKTITPKDNKIKISRKKRGAILSAWSNSIEHLNEYNIVNNKNSNVKLSFLKDENERLIEISFVNNRNESSSVKIDREKGTAFTIQSFLSSKERAYFTFQTIKHEFLTKIIFIYD